MEQTTTQTQPKFLKVLHFIISLPIDLYGFITLMLLLGWILLGERLWFVNLWVNLMPAVFFPLVLCLPTAFLLRRRLSIVLLMPIVILFAVLYGSRLLPDTAKAVASEANIKPTLTVLSHNLLGSNLDAEMSANLITSVDADVVQFQELNGTMGLYFRVNLSDSYPYQALYDGVSDAPAFGRGLISRYPILSDEMIQVPANSLHYQRVEIEFHDEIIVIYNVHMPIPQALPFNSSKRAHAVDTILEHAAEETHSLIIMGDFNSSDQTADYHQMAQQLTDVYASVGDGFGNTFPHDNTTADFPLIRIDYAFASAAWEPVSAQVVMLAHGSDHYPLMVTLALGD